MSDWYSNCITANTVPTNLSVNLAHHLSLTHEQQTKTLEHLHLGQGFATDPERVSHRFLVKMERTISEKEEMEQAPV